MKNEINPAIIIIAFNREKSLERLLRSVMNAQYETQNITLIISIDYSYEMDKIVRIAEQMEWIYGDKIIKTHSQNLGLKKHVLECGDYALEYGAAIILEDDLVVSRDYYEYVKQAQEFYQHDDRIAGVALYSHSWNGYARRKFKPIVKEGDVYFGQFGVSWGQSWTKKQWCSFKKWYEKNLILKEQDNMPISICNWSEKSWGKYFNYYLVDSNRYYVMPYTAKSTCFSEAGVHIKNLTMDNQVELGMGRKKEIFVRFEEGIHYDIFFENEDLKKIVSKYVNGNENIGIDLYGLKTTCLNQYDYILTTKRMKAKVVHSFALQMRPHEMNIIFDIPGEQIWLYENTKEKSKKKISYDILNYEAEGMPWQNAIKYGIRRGIKGGIETIHNIINR